MHSLGSYDHSRPKSRPHIVQVDLAHVSDPRDVLWEAASPRAPAEDCVSEANCAHTRTNCELSIGRRVGPGLELGFWVRVGFESTKCHLYIPRRCRLISRRRGPSSELPARMRGRGSTRRDAGRLAGTIGSTAASFAGWKQLKGSRSRLICLVCDSSRRT